MPHRDSELVALELLKEDVLIADGRRLQQTDEDDGGNDEHEGRVELEDHPSRANVVNRGEDALQDEGPSGSVGERVIVEARVTLAVRERN